MKINYDSNIQSWKVGDVIFSFGSFHMLARIKNVNDTFFYVLIDLADGTSSAGYDSISELQRDLCEGDYGMVLNGTFKYTEGNQ